MECVVGNVTFSTYRPWMFPENAVLTRFLWEFPHRMPLFTGGNEMIEIAHMNMHEVGFWAYRAKGCTGMFANTGHTLAAYNRVHALFLLWTKMQELNVSKKIADYFMFTKTYNNFHPWKRWSRTHLLDMVELSLSSNVSMHQLRKTGYLSSHGHLNEPIHRAMKVLSYDSVQFGFNPAGCCSYSNKDPPATEILFARRPVIYNSSFLPCVVRDWMKCTYCSGRREHCVHSEFV